MGISATGYGVLIVLTGVGYLIGGTTGLIVGGITFGVLLTLT